MKDWFDNLEKREQIIVGIGAVSAAIILFWAAVWMPLDRKHDNLTRSVANWKTSLTDLQVVAANVQSGPAGGATTPTAGMNDSPVVVVDQTLREQGLNNTVKRQQPSPNGIRVEFEDVAFDQLIVWLGELNTRYGMDVQAGSMTLSSRAAPGRINASLTLERAP
ncbi:MAG: type II secretion system protein M [Woeseiaceae bacterium]|nr:type II secretion system protein M [Woeseiaceae bacterium]